MPKAAGGKVNGSHSTATETTAIFVEHASKLREVTKISLGIIKHIGGGGERRIKFLPITGGVKAMVRGSGSVQEVFIYTSNPEKTTMSLAELF